MKNSQAIFEEPEEELIPVESYEKNRKDSQSCAKNKYKASISKNSTSHGAHSKPISLTIKSYRR